MTAAARRFGNAYRPVATARYDASAQQRRGMVAKIHIAKKELQLDDDTYRGAIALHADGETSTTKCSIPQLQAILAHFTRAGFKPKTGTVSRPMANDPSARKARALWISLYQLGAVHNPAEQALEAFAKRQLKVEAMAWANQGQSYKLIEALKSMAERAGWSQSTDGIAPSQVIQTLKLRLCERLLDLAKTSGLAPQDWRLKQAAWSLLGLDDERGVGPMMWSAEQLDVLARGLSAKLRAAGPMPSPFPTKEDAA